MTDVKRYDVSKYEGLEEEDDGEYVAYEDYETLQKQLATVRVDTLERIIEMINANCTGGEARVIGEVLCSELRALKGKQT